MLLLITQVVVETGDSASSWVAAGATIGAAVVALIVALGFFQWLRRPQLKITFEPIEPWCRTTNVVRNLAAGGTETKEGRWVRVRVENKGSQPARACLGKLTQVKTDGEPRADLDPMQLRWAGVPDDKGFEAISLRRGQHEYLNLFLVLEEADVEVVTFSNFAAGFRTQLERNRSHWVQVDIFAENASPAKLALEMNYGGSFVNLDVAIAR